MADDLAPAAGPRWVELEGGTFVMGSDDFYDDEAPARPAHVDPFAIGLTPVTNRQFAAFVDAIGYVTVAERAQGSLVFGTSPVGTFSPNGFGLFDCIGNEMDEHALPGNTHSIIVRL